MKRAVVSLVLALSFVSYADFSITLGGVLPGYSKATDSGTVSTAQSFVRSVAVDVGHTCGLVELFFKDSPGTLTGTFALLESWIPYGDEMRELGRSGSTIVFAVYKDFGSDVLGVLTQLDSGDIALILC